MARPERATIYDVARVAGVSISTVSLAMNRPHRVGADTRARIASAIADVGYRPTGGSRTGLRTLAVAAPFSSWHSYYRRLDGILERCADAGIGVLVHDLPATNVAEAPILGALPVRADLDAVIVMGTPLAADVEQAVLAAGTPAVIVDAESDRLPSIRVDDDRGGWLVGSYLVERGHRSILVAHEQQASFDYVSAGMRRLAGLARAVAGVGGTVQPAAIDDVDVVAALDEAGATAIACTNDDVASRVLVALRRAGRRPGVDVAVTGYDDGAVAESLDLTTVAQPFADSGRAAADLVIGMLAARQPAVRTVVLDVELVVRGSTGVGAGS